MVDFRKRFGAAVIQQIAESIALATLNSDSPPARTTEAESFNDDLPSSTSEPNTAEPIITNRGQLIVDATCATADIRYRDRELMGAAARNADEGFAP